MFHLTYMQLYTKHFKNKNNSKEILMFLLMN